MIEWNAIMANHRCFLSESYKCKCNGRSSDSPPHWRPSRFNNSGIRLPTSMWGLQQR